MQSLRLHFPYISAGITEAGAHNITGDIMKRFFEGLICGVLNGFFGSGGGVAAVSILEHEQKQSQPNRSPEETMKHAHADSVALIFVLSLTAAVAYLLSGGINIGAAWEYIPWGAAGALAGSLFLKKIRALWLRKLFGAVICAAALRSLLL